MPLFAQEPVRQPSAPRHGGGSPRAARETEHAQAAPSPLSFSANNIPVQREGVPAPDHPQGLPPNLRRSMEAMSGIALDDVRVRRDSPDAARLGALAYARGAEIHLGPGQEEHLPHEAWHVVQQKQGRVRANGDVGGVPLNDNESLEREADRMGDAAKASRSTEGTARGVPSPGSAPSSFPIQRMRVYNMRTKMEEDIPDGPIPWGYRAVSSPSSTGGAGATVVPTPVATPVSTPVTTPVVTPPTPTLKHRKDFAKKDRERLAQVPKHLSREDRDLKATHGEHRGVRTKKAHLTADGLETAGSHPLTATEQQDGLSANKPRGNRISSKAPTVGGRDASQGYGGQEVIIKAKKIERARLRGKEDAQHIGLRTTDEVLGELDAGPTQSETGKHRNVLKSFARKDREHHSVVGPRSSKDPRNIIPNRFLIRPDMPETHDSDSESDSDSEP